VSFLQSRTHAAREGIGKHVLRKEDARLLTGGGCYSDDVNAPGQVHACFVRSPHAHARVGTIDTAAALATPGVVAVLTGADAVADGVKPVAHSPLTLNPYEDIVRKDDVVFVAPHPAMPADRVRFVGEIVAMVIAETPAAARDGAERVVVEWSPLPAVTMSLAALAAGAPVLYDGVTSNVCVDAKGGDAAATDAGL
jgi:carbon-monoxide dehydrogenase large subunit